MNDFGTILVGILLGIIVGFGFFVVYIRYRINQVHGGLNALIKEALAEVEQVMVGITVEKENGVYYCYNKDTNQFVCQGATVEEIREAFKKVLPDKITYLHGGDPEAVVELKAALESGKADS